MMASVLESPGRKKWWVVVIVLLAGPIVGAVLGALTNSINSRICPTYYRIILGWDGNDHEVWRRSHLQGMLEGGALGGFFGVTVAVAFAASTRLRGPFKLARSGLVLAMATVLTCWTLGGMCGVALARCFPDLYMFWFPVARWASNGNLDNVAWVGGSIWGAYGGTAAAALLVCVVLHNKWKRLTRQQSPGFEVLR